MKIIEQFEKYFSLQWFPSGSLMPGLTCHQNETPIVNVVAVIKAAVATVAVVVVAVAAVVAVKVTADRPCVEIIAHYLIL